MKGYERPFHYNSCLYELPLSKLKPFSSELKFASIQHVRSRLSYFRMQIATSLAIIMMCCLLPEDECLRSENQSKRYNLRNVSCELRHCVKTPVFFLTESGVSNMFIQGVYRCSKITDISKHSNLLLWNNSNYKILHFKLVR